MSFWPLYCSAGRRRKPASNVMNTVALLTCASVRTAAVHSGRSAARSKRRESAARAVADRSEDQGGQVAKLGAPIVELIQYRPGQPLALPDREVRVLDVRFPERRLSARGYTP